MFWPLDTLPDWLQTVAHLFLFSHLIEAFGACFSPHTRGSGCAWDHLAVIPAWGLGAMLVAVRRFGWIPAHNQDTVALARHAHPAWPIGIARGLDTPRGLAFGPDGALYVAEASKGGAGPCVSSPERGTSCYGLSGAITRL